MYRSLYSLIIIMLSISFSQAKVIDINVDTPYSSGDFHISQIESIRDSFEINDTVRFSNGTEITFVSVFGMHQGYGGLVVLDTTSTLTSKGDGEQIQRDNFFGNVTENKVIEEWYKAESLPEKLFKADDFHFDSEEKIYQASYFIYSSGGETTPYIDDNLTEDFNAISYIKTGNTTLKLQLYTCDEYEGSGEYMDGDEVYNFKFRWAVDSAGNGKFKHSFENTRIDQYAFKHNQFGGNFSTDLIYQDIPNDEEVFFLELVTMPNLSDDHFHSTASVLIDYHKIKYDIVGDGFDTYYDSLSYIIKTQNREDSTIETYYIETYLQLELYTDNVLKTTTARDSQLGILATKNELRISLGERSHINTVTLLSLTGKVLQHTSINQGQSAVTIPLSTPLSTGLYLLSFTTGTKQFQKKFVVR